MEKETAIEAIKELFEEFETVFMVEPQLDRLENIFNLIEAKYRNIKKQQVIADKIVENGVSEDDQLLSSEKEIGKMIIFKLLKLMLSIKRSSESLEAMMSVVKKMTEVMQSLKSNASGLERLPVPTWNGSRRSYPTWKK